MPFTLQNWNAFISDTLHPMNKDLFSVTDESLRILIEQLKKEQDKARTLFLDDFLARPKIKDKKQYVKLHQSVLIRLIDKVYSYRQREDMNDKILKLYDIVSCHLENILSFIEDFFGNHFDRDIRVPVPYIIIWVKEFRNQLELLKQAVQSCNYDHTVLNILVNNFTRFCDESNNGAIYNELTYQKDLLNQLLTGETLASENTIRAALFYYNYNDDDYITYLYGKLDALTKPISIKKEKIAVLSLEQKKFNQLPARLKGHLSYCMPPLKEQINHWIEEEIKFLKTGDTWVLPDHTAKSNVEVYVHVPFKGSELYLIHKAFIDSGGAPAETYKSLFEKTASHLTNKNQKGFSTESLQKSSDKVDYEATENVKRFLQKMIRNIDSY